MTDRPIIFSAPMVRALLAGRKTQTRRLAWTTRTQRATETGMARTSTVASPWQHVKPGDRLWVRENLSEDTGGWNYMADRHIVELPRDHPRVSEMIYWAHHQERDRIPSIHMPRWASRFTLTVTDARRQSLQDIGADDAEAEGLKAVTKDGKLIKYGIPDRDGLPGNDDDGWPWHFWRMSPVDAYSRLWANLHGAESWAANPEVVALTFTVALRNIDAPTTGATA